MEGERLYISIVTVNYNGIRDTYELIDSLRQYLSFSYEIVVVDNASLINEAALIQAEYPDVKCIRSEKNLGFAGGNNLGMRMAKGKYVLLLNNDTYVEDNSLLELVRFLDAHPEVGAVSPKIKYASSPDTIQFAGYTPLSRITLRNHIIGFGQHDNGQYNKAMPTPFLHGAAMMIRREAIEAAGYMPEIYFLYYEEIDWCEQMRKAGFELWYVPLSVVYHKESKSVGQESPLKSFYMTRNRLLFAKRNRSKGEYRLSAIYQLIIAIPKNLIMQVAKGQFTLAYSCINGVIQFFRMKDKIQIVR